MNSTVFITDEKRVWMRLRDHVAIFDDEPDFARFLSDPSGSVLRVLRIWVADSAADVSAIRCYVGSVRRCDCGGWMSRHELIRLFRRATITARILGESAEAFCTNLSAFLREYFREEQKDDARR